jgi:hypothetical protein
MQSRRFELLDLCKRDSATWYSTHICSTVKMVFLYEIFTLNEANIFVALPNACRRSVRALPLCNHNKNGSQTFQLLKPWNKSELHTT